MLTRQGWQHYLSRIVRMNGTIPLQTRITRTEWMLSGVMFWEQPSCSPQKQLLETFRYLCECFGKHSPQFFHYCFMECRKFCKKDFVFIFLYFDRKLGKNYNFLSLEDSSFLALAMTSLMFGTLLALSPFGWIKPEERICVPVWWFIILCNWRERVHWCPR